jgi:hypothetical protein
MHWISLRQVKEYYHYRLFQKTFQGSFREYIEHHGKELTEHCPNGYALIHKGRTIKIWRKQKSPVG